MNTKTYLLGICTVFAMSAHAELPPIVHEVNQQVNKEIQYENDSKSRDYWASASETQANKTGDCEDIAILKRAILKTKGVNASWAYGVLQHSNGMTERHLVALVEDQGIKYVLDNIRNEILPLAKRTDFAMVVYFTSDKMWNDKGVLLDTAPIKVFPQVNVIDEPLK